MIKDILEGEWISNHMQWFAKLSIRHKLIAVGIFAGVILGIFAFMYGKRYKAKR